MLCGRRATRLKGRQIERAINVEVDKVVARFQSRILPRCAQRSGSEPRGRALKAPLKHKSPRSGPLQNVQTAEPFGAMNGLTIADAVSLRDNRVTFCGQKSSCLQFAVEQAT